MLLELKNKKIELFKNLILLNKEDSDENIYILKRYINPIDLNSVNKRLAGESIDYIKSYLCDNEIAYLAIRDNKIEIYRDFFGLSDIYYHFEKDVYRFSETLSDFYYLGIFDVAVEQYKRSGYIPAPNTIINKVKKVFSGEKIIIDLNLYNVKNIRKSISDIDNNKLQYSRETFKEGFEQIFGKNISKADGLLLSGGIDSSLIAYFLSKINKRVYAFTGTTLDINSYIEKERAVKTANLFCKKHSIIKLNSELFEKHFSGILKYMNEPFSDNAILGTSILAKIANDEGIRFVSVGEGGDELFGHANKINKYLFARKFLPNKYFKILSYPLSLFSNKFKLLSLDKMQLIKRFVCKYMTDDEFSDIISFDYKTSNLNEHNIISVAILLSTCMGTEIQKNKLAAKFSGLYVIAPFQEINLLKLALTLPAKTKFKRERAIIRELYDVQLGRDDYDNTKIAMTVPTADWVIDKHKDILLIDTFYKNFETERLINRYLKKHNVFLDQKIWRVFMLNQWYEINKNSLNI